MSPSSATHTLILGLGNPLRGDDGVGSAVIAMLRSPRFAAALPPTCTLRDGGTPGLETALLLDGYGRALIIDAAEMGLDPGGVRIFAPDEVRLHIQAAGLRSFTHMAGLAEALALGAALGDMPAEIAIVGIQPASLNWEIGLSPAVAAAVPVACEHVIGWLRR
jgi:hydrogenase maturation protease